MEFPVLFLGAMPSQTPALYSLMNYAGLKLGTWYPMGGFCKVIDAFKQIAESKGVKFHFEDAVTDIVVTNKKASSIKSLKQNSLVDAVIGSADYHHIEEKLIPQELRNYSEEYWDKKTFAPSSLIFYLGVNKKIKRLNHHNLFFDEDFDAHSKEIYIEKQWPKNPLFYVCCPSKTDLKVAPIGSENVFILMPIAAGINDTEETRKYYFNSLLKRLETYVGENISNHIVVNESYCVNDFTIDYNAYKGNAYGLANTLKQTAFLKPKINNKKIKNLFYAGQLTVPGPGVPPSIISGEIAANEVLNYLNKNQ
jgi:phytoene desaturase